MLLTLFYILLIILLIIKFIEYKLTFWKRQGVPNDVHSIYNRGQQPFHLSDLNSHQKYGKIVGFYEGLKPCLSVIDLDLIRQILVTEFHKFPNHRDQTSEREPIHNALFFKTYPAWKRTRTILSPSFSTGRMKAMKPLLDKCLEHLIEKFGELSKTGDVIDLRFFYDAITMDMIARNAYGISLNPIKNPKNILFEKTKNLFQTDFSWTRFMLFLFPKLSYFFNISFLDFDSQIFISNTIKKVIKQRVDNDIKGVDLLQLSLDAMNGCNESKNSFQKFTEQEVIAQSINFLGAGYETTASALCFATRFLALNPNYQQKLIDEIDLNFGQNPDIDYEELMKMEYLDIFVKEVMRIYSPVNRIDRRAVNDCYLNNIFIPKDTVIIIPIWAVHLDPDNFPDPTEFRPDRFSPTNQSSIKPYSYLPFATGPRNCIGMRFALMEIKATLVKILQKFEFKACDETKKLDFYCLQQVSNMKSLQIIVKKR